MQHARFLIGETDRKSEKHYKYRNIFCSFLQTRKWWILIYNIRDTNQRKWRQVTRTHMTLHHQCMASDTR
jgi:Ni,Fe-hydrogenase III component G